jgi:hypothetical protein
VRLEAEQGPPAQEPDPRFDAALSVITAQRDLQLRRLHDVVDDRLGRKVSILYPVFTTFAEGSSREYWKLSRNKGGGNH